MVQPLWKAVWKFLKKLKIELPYDPAIPLLGTYPDKNIVRNDTCTPMFISVQFTVAKTWKQPKYPSTDEWIKKMYYRAGGEDGGRVRHGDHLPPHRYIRNTSTRGTAPTEHPLNAGRRPQTSQKARNSPRTWVGQKKKEKTDTK